MSTDRRDEGEDERFALERHRMVEEQLAGREIRDPRVLDAMDQIPRHRFVDPAFLTRAYGDHALPTLEGQTISQPWIVARMLELLEIQPHHRVLEIGTGTGYNTALLARLAGQVYSVERVPELIRAARRQLDQLGFSRVVLRHGDGSLGWQEFAPYDRVLVAAAAPHVPEALKSQLAEDGVMVIPVGGSRAQHLEVWRRLPDGRWEHRRRGECRFVPLLGRDAWSESEPESDT